jgi:hypothetical protein
MSTLFTSICWATELGLQINDLAEHTASQFSFAMPRNHWADTIGAAAATATTKTKTRWINKVEGQIMMMRVVAMSSWVVSKQ